MATISERELAEALYVATRAAVTQLFREHSEEHFYYCALVVFAPGYGVTFSAWSAEALAAVGDDEVRWSYADSPYCGFGERCFEAVNRQMLASAEDLGQRDASDEELGAEFALKLRAMESAMARVDSDGLFGTGDRRNTVVLLAEEVGDPANSDRVRRLNPPEAAAAWLADEAEPEWIQDVDRSTEANPGEYRMLQAVRRAAGAGWGDIVLEHASGPLLRLTADGERAKVVFLTQSDAAYRATAGRAALVGIADLDAITRHFLATLDRWPGVDWRDTGWSRRAGRQYRAGLHGRRYV